MKGKHILVGTLGAAGVAALWAAAGFRTARPGLSVGVAVVGLFLLLLAVLAGRPERSVPPEPRGFMPPMAIETTLLIAAVFLALAITAFVFGRAHGLGRM